MNGTTGEVAAAHEFVDLTEAFAKLVGGFLGAEALVVVEILDLINGDFVSGH